MPRRVGKYTVELPSRPFIAGRAAIGGTIEGEGPLGQQLDDIFPEPKFDESSWEKAEVRLQLAAIVRALVASQRKAEEIELFFGGDLLNQCTATSFAQRDYSMPLAGVYGACSTFALALALAALSVDGGGFRRTMAAASSHFCSAEKQFRFPLEYGGQPTPTAQRTATAAGAVVIDTDEGNALSAHSAHVSQVIFGRVMDLGVNDANEMGAAMAPAAADTLIRFLRDTKTSPADYDQILTGDLGEIGSTLFRGLVRKEAGLDVSPVHQDCGVLLYDTARQDAGVGGSGIGCSAAVLCADALPKLERGELKRVLFLGTGALLSAISPMQSETIPAIAHGVLLVGE
ncbi:MAG: stage V sporulation protein AD [Oscillospiraceae bacterium]|nr:stage V sporulation protein AD [Oscillospiraceae bacterium]